MGGQSEVCVGISNHGSVPADITGQEDGDTAFASSPGWWDSLLLRTAPKTPSVLVSNQFLRSL